MSDQAAEQIPLRFTNENYKNRDMLERQATLAFQGGDTTLAAMFAQAAGLYAIAAAVNGIGEA